MLGGSPAMNELASHPGIACVAGVRRGRKEERRAREARENRTREDRSRVPSPSRSSPSRAHCNFPPFLRPATQANPGMSRNTPSRVLPRAQKPEIVIC